MNFNRAIELIEVAIKQDKTDERFHDLLAMLYYDKTYYSKAIAAS